MRVVLDTNVIISRYISPYGTPAVILDHWEKNKFDLLVSPNILEEYDRALKHPRPGHFTTRPMRKLPKSSND
jgi:putative PIN family toxin of toxin-antitoxin system